MRLNRKPTLLVVYDNGSLGPVRLAQAAEANDCNLVFIVAESAHTQEMLPILEEFAPVIRIDGNSEVDPIRALGRHNPTAIVTFSEYQIERTVYLAEELDLPYLSAGDLQGIIRKDAQRKRFTDAGIDSIRFRTITKSTQVEEAIAHVGLPAIIKPISGVSSRNTIKVSTLAECRSATADILGETPSHAGPTESGVIIEELLIGRATDWPWGDFIGVNCVASGDHVEPVVITSRLALAEPFRERGSYSGQPMLSESEVHEVQELACRAVTALNIRQGIAEVEVKLTESGPRIIEVNGRPGGWADDLGLRSNCADLADIAVKNALGWKYQVPTPDPHGPIAFRYEIIPPMTANRVRAIRDTSRLRKVSHVDRVSIHARQGDSVDWRLGGMSSVASLFGTTENHEQLADTVAEIEKLDCLEYE
ncbi:ATP-grasp domain-containing protein [Streptomyces lavenduligriseus]|nr:ATP-grasp domain-containing protein [Streptomyces lavenduligriseus]